MAPDEVEPPVKHVQRGKLNVQLLDRALTATAQLDLEAARLDDISFRVSARHAVASPAGRSLHYHVSLTWHFGQ
jgi:hypothetical protein